MFVCVFAHIPCVSISVPSLSSLPSCCRITEVIILYCSRDAQGPPCNAPKETNLLHWQYFLLFLGFIQISTSQEHVPFYLSPSNRYDRSMNISLVTRTLIQNALYWRSVNLPNAASHEVKAVLNYCTIFTSVYALNIASVSGYVTRLFLNSLMSFGSFTYLLLWQLVYFESFPFLASWHHHNHLYNCVTAIVVSIIGIVHYQRQEIMYYTSGRNSNSLEY